MSSEAEDRPIPSIKGDDAFEQLRIIQFGGQYRGLLEGIRIRGLDVPAFVYAQDWLTNSDDGRIAFLEAAAALLLPTCTSNRVGEEDVTLAKPIGRKYMAEGQEMMMATLIPWLLTNIRAVRDERVREQLLSYQKGTNEKRQSDNDEGGPDPKKSRDDSQEE